MWDHIVVIFFLSVIGKNNLKEQVAVFVLLRVKKILQGFLKILFKDSLYTARPGNIQLWFL